MAASIALGIGSMNILQPITDTIRQLSKSVWNGMNLPWFTTRSVFSMRAHNQALAVTRAYCNPQVKRGIKDEVHLSDGGVVIELDLPPSGANQNAFMFWSHQYSASVDYAIQDVVWTTISGNRVSFVCEIPNGPSTTVQAPAFPEPGTVYWRCIAFFFSAGGSNIWRPGFDNSVEWIAIDGSSGDVWAVGAFPNMTVRNAGGSTWQAKRNGIALLDQYLNPRFAAWFTEYNSAGTDNNSSFSSFAGAASVDPSGYCFVGMYAGYMNSVKISSQGRSTSDACGIPRLNPDGQVDGAPFYPFSGASNNGFDHFVTCIVSDSTGVIAAGGMTSFGLTPLTYHGLCRLTTGGAVDGGFTPPDLIGGGNGPGILGTIILIPGSNQYYYAAGEDLTLNSFSNCLARLNTDGTQDAGFNIGAGITGGGTRFNCRLVADASMNLYVLFNGSSTTYKGTSVNQVFRIGSGGTLDGGYINTGAGVTCTGGTGGFICGALQSSGKLVIAGDFTNVNSTASAGIARLTSGGVLDGTFSASISGGVVRCIVIKSNDEIIIGGDFTSVNGTSRNRIARLDASGNLLGV